MHRCFLSAPHCTFLSSTTQVPHFIWKPPHNLDCTGSTTLLVCRNRPLGVFHSRLQDILTDQNRGVRTWIGATAIHKWFPQRNVGHQKDIPIFPSREVCGHTHVFVIDGGPGILPSWQCTRTLLHISIIIQPSSFKWMEKEETFAALLNKIHWIELVP